MNATRLDAQPSTDSLTHPTLGRSVVDSVLASGRSALVALTGFGLIIGVAVVIAFALTTAIDIPGYDASADY
ncbi:hypothetical protein [Actinoplanes sp. CA-252034]|uniref:hypothetical protein n=1 Tax=Actinoplanes sp. CA-252034 TaxID=3239906 RepID=UPI003D9889EA